MPRCLVGSIDGVLVLRLPQPLRTARVLPYAPGARSRLRAVVSFCRHQAPRAMLVGGCCDAAREDGAIEVITSLFGGVDSARALFRSSVSAKEAQRSFVVPAARLNLPTTGEVRLICPEGVSTSHRSPLHRSPLRRPQAVSIGRSPLRCSPLRPSQAHSPLCRSPLCRS